MSEDTTQPTCDCCDTEKPVEPVQWYDQLCAAIDEAAALADSIFYAIDDEHYKTAHLLADMLHKRAGKGQALLHGLWECWYEVHAKARTPEKDDEQF